MARRRARVARERKPINTDHHRQLVNPFEPLRVLSDDQVAHLHNSAVQYLADEGIKVLFDEARDIFAEAGCPSDEEGIVRLDPDVIANALESSPETFQIFPPNPERNITLGKNNLALTPVGGPPFLSLIHI